MVSPGRLATGFEVGTQFIVENPSDRGVIADADLFLHDDHAPLWVLPEMAALKKATGASTCTCPMCAFNAEAQKITTLMFTDGFTHWLDRLSKLRCGHHSHSKAAGSERDANGRWVSGDAAAYPADFNLYLAKAV